MNGPATAAVRFLSGEREPVRVATTADIALDGLQTIDGIALAVNDRVLVKDQTDARANGIYTASSGLWHRAADARFPRAIAEGITVHVQDGTVHGGQAFRFRTTPLRIGDSDILIDFYLSANFAEDAEASLEDLKQEFQEYADATAQTVIVPLVTQAEAAAEASAQSAADALAIADSYEELQDAIDDAQASATEAALQVAGVIPSVQRFAVGAAVQSVVLGNVELHPAAVRVFIDGVYQFGNTWDLTEGVITPAGGTWPGDGIVENMEVVIDATSAIVFNVPSNGSVTPQKLSQEVLDLLGNQFFAEDIEDISFAGTVQSFETKGYRDNGLGGAGSYRRFVPQAEAQAIINRINSESTTPLTKQREWAITNAVRRLDGAGLLGVGKIGVLLDLGGAGQTDEEAALVDWMDPTGSLATITGTATYTPGKGFQMDGASSYIAPATTMLDVPGVALNNAHMGMFIDGSGSEDLLDLSSLAGIGAGTYLGMQPYNNSGSVAVRLNTATSIATGREVVGRAGHTVAVRSDGSTVQAFRDGELKGESASTATDVSSDPLAIGYWSTVSQYAKDMIGFAHFGGTLSEGDVRNLYDILMEYRHLIRSGANPGGLLQSADGAWWELGHGFIRTPYHYGADEIDDTEAFRNLCALQHEVWVPTPKSFYKVQDEVVVLARVDSDFARVRMRVVTAYSRCFDMRDRSSIKLAIEHEVVTATAPAEGGQHCAVLLGRFHGTQTPVRDVVVDVKINCLTLLPAAVYVIGNVKNPKITYEVTGRRINGAAFLAHWGSQIDLDGTTEHVIQRPRNGHIVRGVAKSIAVAGHRGFYFSGVSKWRVDHLEAHNFTAPMGVAPGDKPNDMDADCYNETVGKLLSELSFGTVILENPAGTACRMWGRTAFIDGKRWYSTDLDSSASTVIENLQIRRGPATVQAGDEAIMLDIDIGANIDIPKLNITNAPGLSSAIIDILEPAVRINGGRNVKIAGRVVGRVGTKVLSGHNIDLDIDHERVGSATEASSASAGLWVESEIVTGTLTAALAAGGTSISLVRSPATHIVPGMEFEIGGVRFVFASSQAGNNLLDDDVVMQIFPAPGALANGAIFTVLGGPSHLRVRGSETGYYRAQVYSSTDPRIPHDIDVTPNCLWSRDDHIEIDGGCGYNFHDGVFDFGNRRDDTAGRDIRINAGTRDVKITGNRFAPSPGSRLTRSHVLANAATSGIIARDNYGYGVTGGGSMFSIPATGADGKANVNSNFEA